MTLALVDSMSLRLTTVDCNPEHQVTALWALVEYVPLEGGRLWSSGFELQNNPINNEEWDTVAGTINIDTTTKRSGDASARVQSMGSGTEESVSETFAAADDEGPFYFRTYLYITTAPASSSENRIFEYKNSGGTVLSYLTLTDTRTLKLYDEDGQVGSASTVISASQWHRIEIKIDATGSGSADTVEGRIDGINFASSGTRNLSTGVNQIFLGGNLNAEAQTQGDWYFDDVALNKNSGSIQNSYPGSGKIVHLRPNADGDAVAWTNAYTEIDDTDPDESTTMITASTLNAIEEANLTDTSTAGIGASDIITLVSPGVRFSTSTATQLNTRIILKDNTGAPAIYSNEIIGVSTTWYTNKNTSPRPYPLTAYTRPFRDSSWTAAVLDNTQIGVQETLDKTSNIQVTAMWLLTEYNNSITISGNAYADEGTTAWVPCDGSTANISLVVNGGTAQTTSCDDSTGAYSFVDITVAAGNPVSVFFNATDKGAAVTVAKDSVSDITANPRKNILWVAAENSATAVTNTNLDHCDSAVTGCSNAPYTVATSNLTVDSGIELHIASSKSFTPGGTVTTQGAAGNLHLDDSSVVNFGANAVVISGNVAIDTSAAMTAPSSGGITIGGNFTNSGTFTHNNGTVTFNDNTKTSQLTYSASTTFYALASSTAGKILEFDETSAVQTIVTNAFTIQGTNCTTNRIFLRAIGDAADDWEIVATGATVNIDYADIKRSTAVATAITADNSTADSDNNTNWTINAGTCVAGIAISGTCKAYDQTTNCGDLGEIRIAVNGTLQDQVDTGGGAGGTFSITGVTPPSADAIITVFVGGAGGTDAVASDRAVAITKYDGTGDITGVILYKEHLTIGSGDTPAVLTSAELGSYDNSVSSDADIFHDYRTDYANAYCSATGGSTVCLQVDKTGFSSQEELYIQTGWTYRPDSAGSDAVAAHDVENLGILNIDNNALTVSGSYLNSGTLTKASGATTAFTSTSAGETIISGSSNFANLTFNGSGGEWTTQTNAVIVDENMTITAGTLKIGPVAYTVAGTTSITGTLSTATAATGTKIFIGAVTVNTSGVWDLSGQNPATSFAGGITHNGATFNNGTGAAAFSETQSLIGSSNMTFGGTITPAAAKTLTNSNTGTVAVSSTGSIVLTGNFIQGANSTLALAATNPFSGAGTFDASTNTNTVNYNGAAQTVKAVAYSNLTLSASGAKNMTNVASIAGDLLISGSATMTDNAAFTVTGALNYSSSGSTTLAIAAAISIGSYNQSAGEIIDNGNTITITGTGASVWVKSGTFTATGTANFTGAAPQIGASNFNNLTIASSGTSAFTGAVTVGNNLIVSTGVLDIGANTLGITNDITATGTLQGTGDVTVNGSVTGAGFITLTGGTFEQVVAAAENFGSSSGSNSWTFSGLKFNNSNGASAYTISPNAGTGTIIISGTLTLGDSGTQNITFDNETSNDRIFDINGSILISTKGAFSASSSASFTLAGNFTDNKLIAGGFTPNSGTVIIDGAGTSVFDGTGTPAITFNNLTCATAGKTLSFTINKVFRISGKLTITGTSGSKINIQSSSASTQWEIDHQGTEDVTYAEIRDSGCETGTTNISLNNTSTETNGNNGSCWLFPSLSFTLNSISVSMPLTFPNFTNTATTTLTISTAAASGYSLTAFENDVLTHTDTSTFIDDWSGSNASPTVWTGNCISNSQCGFGYNTNDADLTQFVDSTYYAGFASAGPGDVVARSTGPVTNDVTTITYKTSASNIQKAGTYQNTIFYIVTPQF